MKRRDFINTSILAALGSSIIVPAFAQNNGKKQKVKPGKVRNILFLVSDGMSMGTLTMADLFLQRKENRSSRWIQLYRENKATRALMDTASADSLVTDSAAGSSSWGSGHRVNNGILNIGTNGEIYKPILQKFKEAGKSVGCVTTVPITHATPAGFCVNSKSRNSEAEIAVQYLDLRFDIMLGGGSEFFLKEKRADGRDLLLEYAMKGFNVARSKDEMNSFQAGKPVLGVFDEYGLPYSLDHQSDPELVNKIPTLAQMTSKAISLVENNPNGFVLQIEGGKVDWAVHANDTAALLYDQVAFDEAVGVAIDFAENRDDTLVIITTDHGNSNPGLIKNDEVNSMFDKIQHFKYTNEWILNGIKNTDSASYVIDRIYEAQDIKISEPDALSLLKHYESLDSGGIYNPYKLPYRELGIIQENFTSVFWSGMNHSADFVELAMFGPYSKNLPPIVKNTDLHNFMLNATGLL
jgi:alkaline phosphatase